MVHDSLLIWNGNYSRFVEVLDHWAACTFILFCVIAFTRKRMMIAIEVIKSAGRVPSDMVVGLCDGV